MKILQSGVDSILVPSMPLLPSDISNSCFSAVKLLRILAAHHYSSDPNYTFDTIMTCC
jgi:hypothetical protein